jgi:mRNA-degrading endonuclease RelE of RelBE toxin-antitoxin system
MWDIKIQPKVIENLQDLSADATVVLFDFIQAYLAKLPLEQELENPTELETHGISTFLRGTEDSLILIFAYIDYETHHIKILHVSPRYYDYDKKLLKLLYRMFEEYNDELDQ